MLKFVGIPQGLVPASAIYTVGAPLVGARFYAAGQLLKSR